MFSALTDKVKKLIRVVQRTEFSFVFGSAIQRQWFLTVTQQAGNYLFSTALILWVLRLGFVIYDYATTKNKNLNANSSLLFRTWQTCIAVTAIIGKLAAATAFFAAAPILLLAAVAADTLRNTVLLGWNTYKFSELYFRFSNIHDDSLTTLKVEDLKKTYTNNMKEHAKSAAAGAFFTAAITGIFLLPHVGVPAVAAIGITVAGIKITLTGLAGLSAAGVMIAPIVFPTINKGLKKFDDVCEYVVDSIFSLMLNKPAPKPPQQKKEKQKVAMMKKEIPVAKPKVTFLIETKEQLKAARKHKLNFNAHSYHSSYQDLIIERTATQELALLGLKKMVDKKIKTLAPQAKDNLSWPGWWQHKKRNQKLAALRDIKRFLENDFIVDKNNNKRIETVDDLVEHIERDYPEVDHSFFLHESDTRNILKALKAYDEKFIKSDVSTIEIIGDRSNATIVRC